MTRSEKMSGTIRSLNFSPRGDYEGLLLETKRGLVQVNLPRDQHHLWSSLIEQKGEVAIEVVGEPAHGHSEHPAYRLAPSSMEGGNASAAKESEKRARHFTGVVARLNYALHGEVNGAVLESGDFLHVRPHGAAAIGLEVGMEVAGAGEMKPAVGGHSVIEASEVNGIRIEGKPKKKKH